MTSSSLCDRCGADVRPVVAVDIDGTLADYHWHFENFAIQWLGIPQPRPLSELPRLYDGSEPYRDWFCRMFETDPTTFRTIKLAYRQGGLKRTQPPLQVADDYAPSEFAEKLITRLGVDLWLTTSRPWDRYDRVDPDTREWLRRHRVPHNALLYSGKKLEELRERVGEDRVIAIVDDQSSVLERARELFAGAVPIRRDSYYNRHAPWLGWKAHKLKEIYKMIAGLPEIERGAEA